MICSHIPVAYPEYARGGVSHILAEKRGVSFTLFPQMHKNAKIFTNEGGGRTPAPPYAGSATACNAQHRVLEQKRVLGHK